MGNWTCLLVFSSVFSCHAFYTGNIEQKRLRMSLLSSAVVDLPSRKNELVSLLARITSNAATSQSETADILKAVRMLEEACPVAEENVLESLGGTWELLWTAQDPKAPESQSLLGSFINPLENQSYSNNPEGRSNPILPKELQDRLEVAGLATTAPNLRSTQVIDLKKKIVRNVVNLDITVLGSKRRASLTVTIGFKPNQSDLRRIDVKFQECKVKTHSLPAFTIPLGALGPTGWLRTAYVDDDLRITRGHKGSVFVLQRPRKNRRGLMVQLQCTPKSLI